MRIKLILQRTGTDQYSAWNEFKEIPVEIPLNKKWGWEVVGAIWEEDAQNIRVEECWGQPEEQEGGGMSNSRMCDKCGNIIRCGEYGYAKYINHQEIGRSTLCPDCIKELMVFLKTPTTQQTEKVLPVLTSQDAQPTNTAGTGGGFRLLDNPHYPDYKQDGRCTFDE